MPKYKKQLKWQLGYLSPFHLTEAERHMKKESKWEAPAGRYILTALLLVPPYNPQQLQHCPTDPEITRRWAWNNGGKKGGEGITLTGVPRCFGF